MAVSRIKTDSNFFFRFAKKFSITKQDIGPFYDGAGDLITDKSEISQLLLEQFSSVFSTPSTDKKVIDPDSFFTYNIDGKPLLADIIIDDEHIVLILFHKMKDMGITGKLGIWFYHFLVNRTQFVRLPGGSSTDSHVISGVPQGTVLGPLLFLILMSDIDEGIVNSKIISFADDTRLYNSVSEVEDCDVLQSDLNTIYKWADANNMAFNSNKFKYVCFTPSESVSHSNVYLCPKMNLIDKVENIKDLGITMSSNCNFNQHINNVYKQCSRLSGWILRTFISRDSLTLLTLFKCIVLSRLDYGSQLWSPHQIKSINKIEQVQRSFTRFITGMRPLSYDERLKSLHLYSVQRQFERYIIIYIWKILESIVPNLSQPITCYFSDRRGRLCHLEHVCAGRLGTSSYNSFRWKAVRLFNCLPQHVRNVSSCSTIIFKKKLDQFLCNLDDKPCTPHFDNSVVHVTKCDTNFVSC